ncbi:hypothetical protein ECZC06_55870 [Escherichia coli]|nr:hypothetical protein ECZC06_55870 [Escherichia coli]
MKNNRTEFIPRFNLTLLLPRYWMMWTGIAIIGASAMVPPALRDPLLGKTWHAGWAFGKKRTSTGVD